MARPPLKQLAALAGVSEATASRVLNGRPGVSDSLRERVDAAMRQLGFDGAPEPSLPRRNVVGVICGDLLNPIFPTMLHHLSTELARKGLLTTVAITDRDLMSEERCITELVDQRVDGVVFVGGHHAEVDGDLSHYEELAVSGMPMVFVNGSQTSLPVPHVLCDEEAGARMAVAYLARLGHTRIGCLLGSQRMIPTRRFIAGYRQALYDAALIEPEHAIIDATFTLEGGRAGAKRLLDRGVTGMIAGNDLMALGAVLAARTMGKDVSVVGYDGTDFTSFTDPPLTTLRQPFEDMARLVSDAIVSEIDGDHRFRDRFVFQPQLLSRASTHRVVVDPIVSHN